MDYLLGEAILRHITGFAHYLGRHELIYSFLYSFLRLAHGEIVSNVIDPSLYILTLNVGVLVRLVCSVIDSMEA